MAGSHSMTNFAGFSTETLSSLDNIILAASLMEHVNGEPKSNESCHEKLANLTPHTGEEIYPVHPSH